MSALSYDEVSVDFPTDDAPETDADIRLCQEPGCTNEVFRNGTRGRWPTRCEEHKKTRSGSTSTRTNKTAPAQAKQAAQVLGGINDMLVMVMMGASFIPGVNLSLTNTSSALAAKNEAFIAQAELALAQDPALARSILRAGKTSGKMALASAYVVLGASLAPAIMADVQAMKGERQSE